jgi:type I restriction enzyme S subunit
MRDSWKKVSLGEVTRVFKETVSVEKGVSYPAAGVMMEGRGLIDREPFVGGVSGYKKLTPISAGQLVLRSITAWEAPITVVPEGFEGRHVSGVFPVFDIDGSRLLPGFMRLVCQWPAFWSELRTRAVGTVLRRKTLNAKQIQEVPLSLPSLAEQRRIVNLLSSVDAYIAALEHQADTARRARNAVLNELLSAGGDDWTETTIGDVADVIGGGTPSTTKPEFWGGEIVWLTPTDVVPQDGQLILDSKRRITKEGLRNSGAQLLPVGSVILTSRASVGFVGISGVELCTNQGFQSLVPGGSVLARFLMYWIQSNRVEFESRAAGSTFKEISRSNVKSIKIRLPSLKVQQQIVEVVSSVDEMIQSTEQAAANAKSLRSGLLSDLLSGDHEIPESYDRLLGAA